MEFKALILLAFLLQTVSYSTSQNVDTRVVLNEENPKYLWTPTDKITNVVVQSEDEDYTISVTVSDVDLKGETFVFIKGGEAEEDGIKEGRAFANTYSKTTKMLFRSTSVFGKLDWDQAKGSGSSAKILFELAEKFGPEPTTIPPTTTEDSTWPTTQFPEKVYYEVLVAGKTLQQFRDEKIQNGFRQALAEMADEYCKTQEINVLTPITQNNVFLSSIAACPSSWPHSDTCVRIKFKLPIVYEEAKWRGYLLDTAHLEKMWRLSSTLEKYGFSAYSDPDYKIAITWWILGITAVIAGFVGLLWILREFSLQIQAGIMNKKSEMNQMAEGSLIESARTSQVSVEAHYLQPN